MEALLDVFGEASSDGVGEHGLGGEAGDGVIERVEERLGRVFGHKDKTGLGTELAGAEGEGCGETAGDGFRALQDGCGKQEDRVCAAHFGVAGDGYWAVCGEAHERLARDGGAGEGDRAEVGMLDERLSNVDSGVEEKREDASGKMAFCDCGADGVGDEFAGAGVGGVSFHQDRAGCGDGCGGVTAGDGKGEREVAGSEDGYRADGAKHGAEIGPGQRRAVGLGGVNPRVNPGAFFKEFGEESKLAGGARHFSVEAREWQGGFKVSALDDGDFGGFEVVGDSSQQGSALGAGGCCEGQSGLCGEGGGAVELGGRGGVEGGFEGMASGGVGGAEGISGIWSGGFGWVFGEQGVSEYRQAMEGWCGHRVALLGGVCPR